MDAASLIGMDTFRNGEVTSDRDLFTVQLSQVGFAILDENKYGEK
jgi:hypothetical protein